MTTTRIRIRRGTEAQILAVTNGLDGEPYYSTDTGKFFIADETGVPQPAGGAGAARSSVSHTTASLAAGGVEYSGTFTVPPSFVAHHLATDYPARVRLYLSAAYRTADLSRPVTADPTGDHGCILEVVTTAGVLDLALSPEAAAILPAAGTTVYLTIQNLDTVARAITVDLDLLGLES